MGKLIDLTGMTFGRLKVIRMLNEKRGRTQLWRCLCECGSEKDLPGTSLRNWGTKSCGCLNREATEAACKTHGMCRSPEYNSWTLMKQRCHNPNTIAWPRYGGRGIKVCERWRNSFENFLEDMGPRPDGHSIDRINNDADYTPLNCRWATSVEQARNTRKNNLIFVNGRAQTSGQWSEETGIHEKTITNRIKLGWKPEAAISKPVKHPRRRLTKSTS